MFSENDINQSLLGRLVGGLYVAQVTDGTVETTFGGRLYKTKVKDPETGQNMFLKTVDPETGVEALVLEKTMEDWDYVPGKVLVKVLPDPEDKNVVFVQNPKFKSVILAEYSDGRRDISRQIDPTCGEIRKLPWKEFVDLVNASGSGVEEIESVDPPSVDGQIIEWLAAGKTNREIGELIDWSTQKVVARVRMMKEKGLIVK
jgi:hypothetical protein